MALLEQVVVVDDQHYLEYYGPGSKMIQDDEGLVEKIVECNLDMDNLEVDGENLIQLDDIVQDILPHRILDMGLVPLDDYIEDSDLMKNSGEGPFHFLNSQH